MLPSGFGFLDALEIMRGALLVNVTGSHVHQPLHQVIECRGGVIAQAAVRA